MSGSGKAPDAPAKREIRIVLVDDIAETREAVKKILGFEPDFKVVGTASNGREGIEIVKQLEPDIVIMDINMPDMDGLEAAKRITTAIYKTGVIMMSVQNDPDYFQKAMLAGARFFLEKPVNMDKLYSTIRSVYEQYAGFRAQWEQAKQGIGRTPIDVSDINKTGGDRAGHVIVVFSGQGGSGKTTIATSLASGLMKEGIKSLLIDASLEFGDCGAFLNLKSQNTLVEISGKVTDLDAEYFDNIVTTHNSGLKVLLAPPNPSAAAEVRERVPDIIAQIIRQVRNYYDFIVVDTSSTLDPNTIPLIELATKIVLVTTPTLPALKNARLMLNVFDSAGYEQSKTAVVLNKAVEKATKTLPPPDKISAYLKRPLEGVIPIVDENIILMAINNGVPVIASDRNTTRAPIAQMIKLSDHLFNDLMGINEVSSTTEGAPKKSGLFGLFGS